MPEENPRVPLLLLVRLQVDGRPELGVEVRLEVGHLRAEGFHAAARLAHLKREKAKRKTQTKVAF